MLSAAAVTASALVVVAAPALLLAILGAASLASRPLGERATAVCMRLALAASSLALGVVAVDATTRPWASLTVDAGTWFAASGYAFHVGLLFDRLSLAFAALTVILAAVVGTFADRYLHRERGYNRFFVLFALFVTGMLIVTLGDSLELMCAGWELVGLSSALLIAFFHERPWPVRNGLRAFVVYRGCDMGLIAAAVLVHHWCGTGDLDTLLGAPPWPAGAVGLTAGQSAAIASAVLIAAMGKSAQLPLSGWLPRAMEGPTPSSAIFYGALSVHAGAYLLLRIGPVLDRVPPVAAAVVAVGLLTALYATVVGRVQSDIKSVLAYASLTQVGLVFVEIGFGFRLLALTHLVGHACLRSLQFLRAPSLLHDFHQMQNAIGGHVARTGLHLERLVPAAAQRRWYAWALERGGIDALLDALVLRPFLRTVRFLDALERRCMKWIGGGSAGPPPRQEVGR
jgi:NAD(P)H-quinone oxidoreductase subunit 5